MSDLTVSLIVVLAGVVAFVIQQWVRTLYEHSQERRSLEIEYLLEAYRALSIYRNRVLVVDDDSGELVVDLDNLDDEEANAMELAVTAAGIHGSREVIEAALTFVEHDETWDPYNLLVALRKEIRDKLRREPLPEELGVPYVHIERTPEVDEEG